MNRSTVSRRGFLKTTAGLAAAGTTVPYFWTSAYAKAASKNDKLNVAAIGVGSRGAGIGWQACNLGNPIAVADVHAGRAEAFAKPFGDRCKIFSDYRKVLDLKEVDVITCGTPDHWHVKVALDALHAGKDVYCEKPLTLTIEESKLICKAVKESGRVFQVGTQQRSEFNCAFLEAVAIARSGRLGEKLKARASIDLGFKGGPWPTSAVPKGTDWDMWLGPAPVVDYCDIRCSVSFRAFYDYSGGQITDWGAHHMDIAMWALGGENTGAIEVEGSGEFIGTPRDLTLQYLLGKKSVKDLPNSCNVAYQFQCNLKLVNGNTIVLDSGHNDVLIEGEKGRIAVNRGSKGEGHLRGKIVDQIKQSPTERDWLQGEVIRLCKGKKPGSHMQNFFECVKDRSLPISDVYTHCNSINACHMSNIAMLLGRKVRWDLEKQQFIDDAEANALMHRAQRPQYRAIA